MLLDSKCVQTTIKAPTFHTSTEQTNVVSAFNEANGSPTNETFRTTNFEETAMNGLYHTRFVVGISFFNIYFFSVNEIKYLY